ncbi:outer membrane beta-barrel protein [Winogradskyella maritima]|uniref:Outer membrane beta-barrel protein n=1 Tax=Winogradskyella maritima TaxID=1517766 RepID=A0ABV8AJ85_9FLAO|nr:outer membrane beta-barrel protein [Winogradskyella maritima]
MKKLILTGILCSVVSLASFAQVGSGFGFKGGLNYGGTGEYFRSISDNFENPDRNIGYHLGLFGKIGDRLYLRPELVYTKVKTDYESGTFDLQKFDAPILVGAKILGPISVFGGPALQYILDSEFNDVNVDNIENDFTVGLNFGIALNFNKVGIDLRYERGFSENEARFLDNNNIMNGDRLDTRPEQLILSLSLKI